jgi:hypothetical protein
MFIADRNARRSDNTIPAPQSKDNHGNGTSEWRMMLASSHQSHTHGVDCWSSPNVGIGPGSLMALTFLPKAFCGQIIVFG